MIINQEDNYYNQTYQEYNLNHLKAELLKNSDAKLWGLRFNSYARLKAGEEIEIYLEFLDFFSLVI